MINKTEVWLRGPLPGMPVLLQPVAHALLQAREEINDLMTGFDDNLLWEKPAGIASTGFHLQHLTGVLSRLFTYARGEQLTQKQLDHLAQEGVPSEKNCSSEALVNLFNSKVDQCITQLQEVDKLCLTAAREVGRKKLPSTVMGLYVHAAEHTFRHVGQLLVTVKCVQTYHQRLR